MSKQKSKEKLKEEPKIKIEEPIIRISDAIKGLPIKVTDLPGSVREELKKQDKTIRYIIYVLLIGYFTLLITVIGIAIGVWNIRTSSYKELTEKNMYLEKIINEYKLEQKELKTTIENLRKDINKISDNISLNKPEKK